MGMSIDEAITHIMDVICENNTIKHSDLVVFNNEKQALRTAIDIMCKYQKIEQIIRNYDVAWEFHPMKDTIDKIREVIEDGNDKAESDYKVQIEDKLEKRFDKYLSFDSPEKRIYNSGYRDALGWCFECIRQVCLPAAEHNKTIPKADYEKRLKADLVAMLIELKTEIAIMSDTVVESRTVTVTSWRGMQKRICKLIQSKIDKLEGNA